MRSNLLIGFAVLAGIGFAGKTLGSIIEGPVTNPDNGHTYYLLSSSDWSDAEALAESIGGHLATVRSQAENDFIFNTFGNQGNLWIGLSDPMRNDGSGALHAADFQWADGSPVAFTNWSSGEPNNFNNAEYATELFGTGDTFGRDRTWNDAQGDVVINHGVAEVVPEPTSLAVFVGALALTMRLPRSQKNSK